MAPSAYTSINDSEIDHLVNEITSVHPQSGEKTIQGKLLSWGIRLQRWRLRNSLARVDPLGIEFRKQRVFHRRVYNVKSSPAHQYAPESRRSCRSRKCTQNTNPSISVLFANCERCVQQSQCHIMYPSADVQVNAVILMSSHHLCLSIF